MTSFFLIKPYILHFTHLILPQRAQNQDKIRFFFKQHKFRANFAPKPLQFYANPICNIYNVCVGPWGIKTRQLKTKPDQFGIYSKLLFEWFSFPGWTLKCWRTMEHHKWDKKRKLAVNLMINLLKMEEESKMPGRGLTNVREEEDPEKVLNFMIIYWFISFNCHQFNKE